ncbi:HD domain-containing protein [Anaeroplasma bactoclasticum]|jgi:HD-GYP domain-containing protein (c-di-GMP phosphodiesterase class II)|uniref:HD domain-containing protein n=1 Tax=Anaeroplasma bactoclasticum TaxID=2088 RepID=A0A397QY23_9MOLU|nr:HD domain-containing phosphohydrolase [Anaeroplasma bactoclasticum]RIA64127.1 HD domain-containing protein [Anaeroplasma bactoclasticum]
MENKYYNENYYNANTVLKFLRKVLNEINKSYVDSGMRTAFLMKRYIEKYKIDQEHCHEHVLLCMLKDIGLFYMDGAVPSNDPALAAASSYAFLHQCSPLDANARPLLFYKAKYMEDVNNPDYDMGLLMTLLYQVSLYIYQRKDVEEIEEILREDRKRKIYNPDQVKKVIKLLKDSPDIIEKLNSESELYVYETSRYISLANYGTDTLGEFLDTTSFMFEFHNHETMAHTVTTAQIAYDLAIACKLTESTSRAIEIAGKVHDIGKIRVPLEILCFPGKLEGEALAEMQNHAKYTKEIIEGCFSYVIVEIASRHHEKLDGSGYPLGITKKDLTSADKVLAVADICSALYCKRSYKAAFTPEKIQSILISDAKAGKLDERIVNHLIDDYDRIMANAKAVEDIALKKYETMKDEYEALAKSPALRHVFGESEDLDSERPESIAADETEEYISDVIKYDMKKDSDVEEQIIYVDENGNEIDYNPEDEELYSSDPEEAVFALEEEKKLDPLEEYNQAEMGDVPIEEIKNDDEEEEEPTEEVEAPVFDLNPKEEVKEEESPKEEQKSIDDEFDAFLNSIPEVEDDPFKDAPKKKPFVPKVPLKHPKMDFDPFKEDIDPVFQEPILPKEESKEDIDLEFDAFLNSIPEVKEDPFKEDETIEESKEEPNLELNLEDNQEAIEEEQEIEESVSNNEPEEETEEIDDTIDESESEEAPIEETEESSEELEEEETEESDNDPFEDEEEIDESIDESESEEEADDAIEESSDIQEDEDIIDDEEDSEEVDDSISDNDAINSKYDDIDEEIDDSTIEEVKKVEEEKEDDYVTSYVDEDEFDLIEDEKPEDSIIPDESKYELDPNEEIDSSIEELDSNKEDDYVESYMDEDEEESEEKIDDSPLETKSIDDTSESSSNNHEEDEYVTSYFSEEELEEDSKETENKEDEYVTSYVEEEEESNKEEPLKEESKKNSKSIDDEDDDDSDDEDEDDDDDDDDDDEDEEDEEEDDEDEEEDKDPKHKKFFSNDIYRKMFTYNPKNKKK